MKPKRLIFILFTFFMTFLIFSTAQATTSAPMNINYQGTLPNGLKTDVEGTINSIADISNGNLSAKFITASEQDPNTVKQYLMNGPIQVNADSTFTVLTGNSLV